jgi:hypothetical protein
MVSALAAAAAFDAHVVVVGVVKEFVEGYLFKLELF